MTSKFPLDAQDWRQRQEQMKSYATSVNDVVDQLEGPMEHMITEAKSVMEKVKTREKFINGQFEALLTELSFAQVPHITLRTKAL